MNLMFIATWKLALMDTQVFYTILIIKFKRFYKDIMRILLE